MEPQLIPIREIEKNATTQVRAMLSQETIAEYAEALRVGHEFPPICVVYDGFASYWIADGWHRFGAYVENGERMIPAIIVKEGNERDALLYAVTKANRTHGLRRTNADKRRTVEIVLRDPDWSKWSDRKVASECGVGYSLVADIRRELQPQEQLPDSGSCKTESAEPQTRIGKDGKERKAPTPRAQQTASEPTPTASPAKSSPKVKNGAEKVTPALRKQLKATWGQFVRGLSDAGWLPLVDAETKAISEKLGEQWGK